MTPEIARAIAKQVASELIAEMGELTDFGEVTTTDATPTVIATLEVTSNTAGTAEFHFVAAVEDDAGNDGARVMVHFNKFGGTLTLGTPVELLPFASDLDGGSYQVIASGGNIVLEGIGSATLDTTWRAEGRLFTINYPGS
jgi:hypothetical protein